MATIVIATAMNLSCTSVQNLEALHQAIAVRRMDVKVTPIAGLDIGDLPSLEDIGQRKGSQEGERLFVRTPEGTVEVYAWDSGRYEKIGLVTDGAPNRPYKGTQSQVSQSRPKVYLDGKPYDYVFDVDVDGKMLKLPYNRNQNVFEAAQSFINENSQFVSQIHKEEIQNFILQNIDPQDVQQLIGSQQQPSAAPTAAGGGAVSEPLFSQFAREAALMRESGASHVPSYTEALRNLESAGVTASDVAFSAYAREEIELQKSQKASQEPAVEKNDVVAWTKHALLTAFNTEGAQKKVIELTGDATSGEVVRRVEKAVTGDPSVEVLAEAIRLYTQLPESSRFPALDLLRYLLAVVPRPYEWLMLLLNAEVNVGDTSPLEFMKECVVGIGRMHDLEKLVAVRLFHHVAAAVDGLPANTTLAVEQVDVLSDMFTTAPNSLIKSNMNGNLKRAISALLQSVSLVLAHGTPSLSGEFRLNCTRECMRMISRLLLLEPISSPLVADLLATVLTLLQTHSVADAAAEVGRSSLLHVVGALRNGSEQRCRGAVDKILRILDTEAS
uniref:WGS project CAEQ00000000 data, annotated contig 1839 n=1 Tax=Trypanosoma congolense (strain IL3000) TaxID=1068625 RepID=F9W995_TRYCI|nr:unnamed protein product [Trypanosoma congolense IL3000]